MDAPFGAARSAGQQVDEKPAATGRTHDSVTAVSAVDRKAILEILRETKPDLPAYWGTARAQ